MNPNNIMDRDSLEAWLKPRPQADAVAIAQRVALRMFPLWSGAREGAWARAADLTALSVFRLNLISGVARRYPTPEVSEAAAASAKVREVAAASDSVGAAAAAVSAAADAARAAAFAPPFAAPFAARAAARAFAAVPSADAFWKTIQEDAAALKAGKDSFTRSLWPGPQPDWFTDADTTARAILARDPETWSFWLRWWDGVLSGNQLDWDLQIKVALIPVEIWQQGPVAVSDAIRQIELDFAIARTPNAEEIRINPQTGLIRLVPVSHLNGNHLADIVDTMRDAAAVFDGQGGPNGPYGALADECGIVKDAYDRYATRPIMLFRICRRVVERASLKEANGDCPKADPLVRDFITSIAGAAGDLMAFDSDVREAETARAASVQAAPSPENAKALVYAADQSASISEGDLKAELPVSARLAVSEPASPEGQVALYETKSRLLRILQVTSKAGKGVRDHVEGNPVIYGSILAVLLFLIS